MIIIKKKIMFSSELAYLVGLVILAFGTAFMESADFGVSMVVAPAYLLHLKISEYLSFFTFGMAEYTLQAVILILMILVLKQFKKYYLFSFVTAVLYGLILDGSIFLVSFIPNNSLAVRIIFYIFGLLFGSAGVSLLFNTYIAPEVYELFVKEVSMKYGFDIHKTKTVYDCISCAVAIILSFIFFGFMVFRGVKFGTIICALINGFIISLFTKFYNSVFEFKDSFKFRSDFE